MSTDVDGESLPFLEGALAGVGAWLVGYLATYLLVGTEIRESGLNRIVEAFEGEGATYELVGWVFYNAHLVDVVYDGLGGSFLPASFVGGEDGVSVFVYAVPPLLLFAAGLAVGRYRGVATSNRGALAGLAVLPGYLVPSVAGVVLFEVSAGGTTGHPDLVPAALLAGVVYPLVFAAAGGAVAGLTSDEGEPTTPRSDVS